MGFNLEKYIKGSAKDAFSRMSEDASNQLRDAAINSVTKTFGGALKKLGFSNKIVSSLTSKMADAAQAELAERFFKKANPEINRIPAANGEGVRQNRVKGFQETVNDVSQIIGKPFEDGAQITSYPTERGYYYCQLTFYNYSRPNAHDNGELKVVHTIYLPLPAGSNLVERQSLKLTPEDLGMGGALGDLFAKDELGLESASKTTMPIVERVVSKVGNAAIDGVGDGLVNFAQQAFAYAPNPHTSVMFQGVNLRSHQFNWRMSPETPTESAQISEIARLLRFSSLPVFFNDTTALFSYPMICKVKFFAGDKEHPYLYNFSKYCMIQDVSINYAPNGVPSFFSGTNAPTSVEIGLQLQEIEYFTAESYGTSSEMKAREREAKEILPFVEFTESKEQTPPPAQEPPPPAENLANKKINAQPTENDIRTWWANTNRGTQSQEWTFRAADGKLKKVQFFKQASPAVVSNLNPAYNMGKPEVAAPNFNDAIYAKVEIFKPDGTTDGKWMLDGKYFTPDKAGEDAAIQSLRNNSLIK